MISVAVVGCGWWAQGMNVGHERRNPGMSGGCVLMLMSNPRASHSSLFDLSFPLTIN